MLRLRPDFSFEAGLLLKIDPRFERITSALTSDFEYILSHGERVIPSAHEGSARVAGSPLKTRYASRFLMPPRRPSE